ncbi:gas vesicle protein [Roseococcus suduntuyensis]|nr:gas vesicle protein [Roseococcus suduntuyensis]
MPMAEPRGLAPQPQAPQPQALVPQPQALVDVLDRLLDTGVVLDGQLVISVAGVDLVHVGLRALLASVETAARLAQVRPETRP